MRARYHGAGSEMRAGDITHSCTRLLTGSAPPRLSFSRPVSSAILSRPNEIVRSPKPSYWLVQEAKRPGDFRGNRGSIPFERRFAFLGWRSIDKSRGTTGPGDRGIPRQVCTNACVRALISNGLTEGPAGRSVPRSPLLTPLPPRIHYRGGCFLSRRFIKEHAAPSLPSSLPLLFRKPSSNLVSPLRLLQINPSWERFPPI